MISDKIEDQVYEALGAMETSEAFRILLYQRIMEIVRNAEKGARGSAPAALLSARSNRGTETDSPVERMSAERAPSIACAARCRPEQGSAEEEERLCPKCEHGLAMVEDRKYGLVYEKCPTCKGTGKRPDETATGERGGVRSAEAWDARDWWQLYHSILHGVTYDGEGVALMTYPGESAAKAKQHGFLLSRISGDGTSERRADNVEAQGMQGRSP